METLEKAAKVRFQQGLDSSFEASLEYVKSFPEEQLNKLAAIYDEEQAYRDYANDLFEKYLGSGKTVMTVVKENISDIKEQFNHVQFIKYGVEENGFERHQIL